MSYPFTYLTKTVLVAIIAALALALGCGGESGGATVNSALLGIYEIDRYQFSSVSCEDAPEAEPLAPFVALYSFATDEDPDDPLLLGRFCGSVQGCRNAIRDFPTVLTPGYSFIDGNDASGWRGWSIANASPANDQCGAEVQAHVLTSTSANEIQIETKTFVTVFDGEPAMDGTSTLICANAAAIESLRDDPPCSGVIIVAGTFAAGL